MKVPPKRKGNGLEFATRFVVRMWALNESPSEKEGKLAVNAASFKLIPPQ